MTTRRKDLRINVIIYTLTGVFIFLYSVYVLYSYQILSREREKKVKIASDERVLAEGKLNKIIAGINTLKEKKSKMFNKNVNLETIKQDVLSIVRSIKVSDVRVGSVGYYKNYNNLIEVVITVSPVRKSKLLSAKTETFKVKKILEIGKVKKVLKVYGEYKISGNEISFLMFFK